MEWSKEDAKPLIRIAIVLAERSTDFESNLPFQAYSLEGKPLFSGAKGKSFRIAIGESTPAKVIYRIRFAIADNEQQADTFVQKWQKQGHKTEAMWVGQRIPLAGGREINNREIWIISKPFSSREEAENVRQLLEDFGSTTIISQVIAESSGYLSINGKKVEAGLRLVPIDRKNNRFLLRNVRVGAGFHWDHRETQIFSGKLEFRIDSQGQVCAINVLDLEEYLASVNSSEMPPECNLDFLKAQTIAARSTIFATAGKHHWGEAFDLCATDHCQCFYGVGKIRQNSRKAATQTNGEVLMHKNKICDARYAKLCAGITESYENVWDNRKIPYLSTHVDNMEGASPTYQTLTTETAIKQFLNTNPEVFCNPTIYQLPPHLEYARHYFHWEVNYSPEELGEIVQTKSGKNLGAILDIIPLKRGYSGRLMYVKLIGEKGDLIVGKELEIRRVLSSKHLYSSCFYVEKIPDSQQPKKLLLKGRGWGHGVGMCQIGAAVMGELGYDYATILSHYYPDTQLEKIY